jgi:acyl-CoA thioesterase I
MHRGRSSTTIIYNLLTIRPRGAPQTPNFFRSEFRDTVTGRYVAETLSWRQNQLADWTREINMNWHRSMKRFVGYTLFVLVVALHGPAAAAVTIVAFGDSNTAGFGVPAASKYPSRLQQALRARGLDVVVKNSGINGDTSGGGLRRLNSAVPEGTAVAIVFFGRNDVRFGVPAARMRANLDAIVGRLRARGVQVILCGFHPFSFADIAAKHGAIYAGDFFAGVAVNGVKKQQYSLGDFVPHLNAAGYSVVASRLTPIIEQALRRR